MSLSSGTLGQSLTQARAPRQRAASRAPVERMPPEEKNEILNALYQRGGQAFENLHLALDTIPAIGRGILAMDPLSGFNWDVEKRISGPELLEKAGIAPRDPYIKATAGFATEVATDPLFWFSGGLSALSKGGDAARAAGPPRR